MVITKQTLSILNYIHRKQLVTYASLSKHFKTISSIDSILDSLVKNKYVKRKGDSYNKYGEPIPIEDSTLFELNDLGIAEVESHQWFNTQYVLTSLLIPLIVGVASSVITALILLLL